LLRILARYHRYRVRGLDHIPRQGPAIIAVSHSLITYDVALLALRSFNGRGRMLRGLGDRSIFRTPGLRSVAWSLGAVEANRDMAVAMLAQGEVIVIAPGGMREALRPSTARHQVLWQRRKGFVRLALETGAPIILAACPAADDALTIYENRVTKGIYRHMRMPLPVARGVGLSTIPRPVALTHLLSEPLLPPPGRAGEHVEDLIDRWHAAVCARMDTLMAEAADRRL